MVLPLPATQRKGGRQGGGRGSLLFPTDASSTKKGSGGGWLSALLSICLEAAAGVVTGEGGRGGDGRRGVAGLLIREGVEVEKALLAAKREEETHRQHSFPHPQGRRRKNK